MADITKCTNSECELKEHCYRWTAKSNEYWQSVRKYEFTIDDEGRLDCENLLIKR